MVLDSLRLHVSSLVLSIFPWAFLVILILSFNYKRLIQITLDFRHLYSFKMVEVPVEIIAILGVNRSNLYKVAVFRINKCEDLSIV